MKAALTMALALVGSVLVAQAAPPKIYIGSMGPSEYSERFRLLLEDELRKVGLRVVEDEKQAEVVIDGVLTNRRGEVTVRAKNAKGQRIWSGDFRPTGRHGFTRFTRVDPLRLRAIAVAKALSKKLLPH